MRKIYSNTTEAAVDIQYLLNSNEIFHYLHHIYDKECLFYIKPSQHFEAFELINSVIHHQYFKVEIGIDSDYEYWINIVKY